MEMIIGCAEAPGQSRRPVSAWADAVLAFASAARSRNLVRWERVNTIVLVFEAETPVALAPLRCSRQAQNVVTRSGYFWTLVIAMSPTLVSMVTG